MSHFQEALLELKENGKISNLENSLEFSGQLHHHIGNLYFKQKLYDKAIEEYEQAVYLDPEYMERFL